MKSAENSGEAFNSLCKVIQTLVSPAGCPWDREQTPESLADYVIEESHELVAAIRSGDPAGVCEELGDVFFLLLLIADCYERKGIFSLADALENSSQKMIRRHPHVFSDAQCPDIEQHMKNWEKIKREEHEQNGQPKGLYASLPQSLPPLIKAYRIHSKAAKAGFTWPTDEEVEQQVESEWLELLDALQNGDSEAQKHELGDILFTLVELGRRKGIKANEALDLSARRFLTRFNKMEKFAADSGRDILAMNLDDQDELWNRAKLEEDGRNGAEEEH